MSGSGLLLGSMSGFTAHLQLRYVLMFMATDINESQEIRALQLSPPLTSCSIRENWSCPSPAEALRREDPTPHLGSTIELTLFVGSMGELVLRA